MSGDNGVLNETITEETNKWAKDRNIKKNEGWKGKILKQRPNTTHHQATKKKEIKHLLAKMRAEIIAELRKRPEEMRQLREE